MNYLFHLLIYFGIYSILAMSLNIFLGFCGYLSLAHAGFYALGAYVYALVTLKLGLGFLPAIGLAVVLAALLSLSLSLPSWRFRGDYFIMVTLAVQVFLHTTFNNWYASDAELGTLANMTNGPFGIAGVPSPQIFGMSVEGTGGMAALSLATAGVCALLTWWLLSSPWGRLLRGIRDDELATRGFGKPVRLAKVQAFGLSCAMAAVAGVLYVSYVTYVDPSTASLDESILILSMVIVGGVGNFRGPIVGAAVLLTIPEILRFIDIPSDLAPNIRLFVYGLLLVLMMHFRSQGIAGDYSME